MTPGTARAPRPATPLPAPCRADQAALTSRERALLRLLVSGQRLEDAAPALGLPLPEAEALLEDLRARHGASSATRLLVLAVLNAWV